MLDLSCSMHDLCLESGIFLCSSWILSRCGTWAPQHTGSAVTTCALSCFLACGILVSWSGIKPTSPCIARQTLNYWTTKEVARLWPFEKNKACSACSHLFLLNLVVLWLSQTCFSRSTLGSSSLWDLKTCRSCLGNESKQFYFSKTVHSYRRNTPFHLGSEES